MPHSPRHVAAGSRVERARQVAGGDLRQRRNLGLAARIGPIRAAWPERTARGEAARIRRYSRDGRQLQLRLAKAWASIQQSTGIGVTRRDRYSSDVGASSTMRPAYITATRSAKSATTPRSCVIQTTAMPNLDCSRLTRSRIWACVGHIEGGRGFVGDEDLRIAHQGHSDHHALTHAARELVRIRIQSIGGLRDADQVQELGRLGAAPRATTSPGAAAVPRSSGARWSAAGSATSSAPGTRTPTCRPRTRRRSSASIASRSRSRSSA